MTAQVIFLNKNYFPKFEELMRLQNLQDRLTLARIELSYATRFYSRSSQELAFMRYHHGFRYKWLVYEGNKKYFAFNLYNPNDAG